MEGSIEEALNWQSVRDDITRLECESDRLRSWGRLAIGLNLAVVLSVIFWFAWPAKTLRVQTLTTSRLDATVLATDAVYITSDLVTDGLFLMREAGVRRMSLGFTLGPRLNIYTSEHGELDATVISPSLVLYAKNGFRRLTGDEPQLELLIGPNGSPRIVLRDVHNQVIWNAP
jgi:hypothetical protein